MFFLYFFSCKCTFFFSFFFVFFPLLDSGHGEVFFFFGVQWCGGTAVQRVLENFSVYLYIPLRGCFSANSILQMVVNNDY